MRCSPARIRLVGGSELEKLSERGRFSALTLGSNPGGTLSKVGGGPALVRLAGSCGGPLVVRGRAGTGGGDMGSMDEAGRAGKGGGPGLVGRGGGLGSFRVITVPLVPVSLVNGGGARGGSGVVETLLVTGGSGGAIR